MNFINFIKYEIWPTIKVRLTYWWWAIRYGGKKNIPPELIFGRIMKNAEQMKESLEQALHYLPPGMSEKEKSELLNLLGETDAFESKLKNLKRK